VDDASSFILAEAIKLNNSVALINLNANPIEEAGKSAFKEARTRNTKVHFIFDNVEL
jgi:hypothetical protein